MADSNRIHVADQNINQSVEVKVRSKYSGLYKPAEQLENWKDLIINDPETSVVAIIIGVFSCLALAAMVIARTL